MNSASLSMIQATTAYVALGSNLGDRIGHLREAVRAFRRSGSIVVTKVSPVYESKAHTLEPDDEQPSFLNAVVELRTSLSPTALLTLCQAIEEQSGRDRATGGRWMPRTLDLDVLIFGHATLRERGLTVPHPRISERRFVLRPLADVNPDLTVPPPHDAPVWRLLEICPDTNELVRTSHTLLHTGD